MMCMIEKASKNNPACHDVISGISYCPECGKQKCPRCDRHGVEQISRITGYISTISGWNNGKQQELKDRKRYNLR